MSHPIYLLSKRLLTDKLFYLALLVSPLVLWVFIVFVGQPKSADISLKIIFLNILLRPILEEIVFRGQLQGFLFGFSNFKTTKFGISIANIISSALFALLHLIYQPPLWALAVFVPSLLFGFFYQRYQHILPSVLLHGFYNLLFLYFAASMA